MQEDIIEEFVKLIDDEIVVTFEEDEAGSYFSAENNILNIDINNIMDMGFTRHIKEKHGFDCSTYSLLFLCVLHELGHSQTYYYCEEDFETRCLCALVPMAEAIKNPKVQDIYYDMPDEWEATEWAINFIKNNRETCRLVDDLLSGGNN